jgi:hypothetical protein
LIFDVFQPRFSRIALGGTREVLELDRTDEDGSVIRRFSQTDSHRWRQVIGVTFGWEIESQDGNVQQRFAAFEMRRFVDAEVRHLPARAGFEVEAVYGSFDGAPVGPESNELVFVAVAATAWQARSVSQRGSRLRS